jgi:hypothetical protein
MKFPVEYAPDGWTNQPSRTEFNSPHIQGKISMKRTSILIAALLALGLGACGEQQKPPAPASKQPEIAKPPAAAPAPPPPPPAADAKKDEKKDEKK